MPENVPLLTRRTAVAAALLGAAGFAASRFLRPAEAASTGEAFEIMRSDAEWKKLLTPEQYVVLRHEGTERPFTSPLNDEKRAGTFSCAGCDLPLFSSATKYDSRTGWPSFYAPIPQAVATRTDGSLFMVRTEVHCRRCGGHLGHVFDDGPPPTGKRYCMNGVAMKFAPADKA